MKGFVIFYIISAFAATGYCLVCHECANASTTCIPVDKKCRSSEDMCVIVSEIVNNGTHKFEGLAKGCENRKACIGEFSGTFGPFETSARIDCCNNDKCNTMGYIAPAVNMEKNNIRCHSCFGSNENECLKNDVIIDCRGKQEYCLKATGSIKNGNFRFPFTMKGCITKNACDMGSLSYATNDTFMEEKLYCCKENVCNTGTTIYHSFFLQALGVIFLWVLYF